jgi:hypothetical protein
MQSLNSKLYMTLPMLAAHGSVMIALLRCLVPLQAVPECVKLLSTHAGEHPFDFVRESTMVIENPDLPETADSVFEDMINRIKAAEQGLNATVSMLLSRCLRAILPRHKSGKRSKAASSKAKDSSRTALGGVIEARIAAVCTDYKKGIQ